ncbi:hypothetical protein C8J46_10928 [Sphingomonas sp. PP-F2F-A104-K0414]|uniref:hypothetical protein n=1 Tax=Sphingomonas sp. PP-F2F-A104-K0414 TaxID=2135661 RepID=UPI001042CC09|nr:hypothetical protein [Sphingomonas sp. PP-F2F-A104-K0414]TCP96333.1 hypothetical protein C8J46_10928 [Sphingomonas sp. PP-F2F-A104-K0414]
MSHPEAPMIDMDDKPTLARILSSNPAVSSVSLWNDNIWRLDGESGGQTSSSFAISWKVKASPRLIDEAKMLAALHFLKRDGEYKLKHTTASTFSTGIRHLLRFMTTFSYFSFDQLDEDAFKLFEDNLAVKLSDPEWFEEEFGDGDTGDAGSADPYEFSEEDFQDASETVEDDDDAASTASSIEQHANDSDAFTRAAAHYRLRCWRHLFDAAEDMHAAGCRTLSYDPFAIHTLKERTEKASSLTSSLIPPLPDAVSLRIMKVAQALLEKPADDVIELQRRYVRNLARLDRDPTTSERRLLRAEIENFKFADVNGKPWHEAIVLPPERPGGGVEMKELITLIRNAAILIIFCGTGVRIGELCSIVADPTQKGQELPLFHDDLGSSKIPHCVTLKPSKTRMNEHLFVTSRLFKNERSPREETWLIGSRPLGTDIEPPVLRALRVLEALYAPWRTLAKSERTRSHLILSLLGSGLPRSSAGVAPIQSSHLRTSLSEFIQTNCELADLEPLIDRDRRIRPYVEGNGKCIRPHQWRKTFALYMMKIDDRMVPALAHHFKHMSIAVTENSYMPNDPTMLAAQDSVHAQEAARWIYEQRHGAGGTFGRLDEIMKEHREEWEKLVPDLSFESGLPQITRFLIDKDIRIFHADHGRCVIGANPDQARCHEAAGTSSWRNARPNYAQRTPGQCTGCTNYSVSPEHAGYWRKRYISYQGSWLASDRSPQFRVMQKRAQQAAAILRALHVPLPVILVEAPSDRRVRKGTGH